MREGEKERDGKEGSKGRGEREGSDTIQWS